MELRGLKRYDGTLNIRTPPLIVSSRPDAECRQQFHHQFVAAFLPVRLLLLPASFLQHDWSRRLPNSFVGISVATQLVARRWESFDHHRRHRHHHNEP
jgi:hypothetical protein